jgi:hypothetical protein
MSVSEPHRQRDRCGATHALRPARLTVRPWSVHWQGGDWHALTNRARALWCARARIVGVNGLCGGLAWWRSHGPRDAEVGSAG